MPYTDPLRQKEWRLKNKEHIRLKDKAYYDSHKKEAAEYSKKRYILKCEEIKCRVKKHYESNKERINKNRKAYGVKYRELNKERDRLRHKKYRSQNKVLIKKSAHEYNTSERGSLLKKKCVSKRRRALGYNIISLYYIIGCVGHHLDITNVVFIPKELHKSVFHTQKDNESMMRINILAWSFLEASVL